MSPSRPNPPEKALIHAARAGNIEQLQAAIARGANVNQDVTLSQVSGMTPLMLASNRGSAACVAALLEAGADVHAANSSDIAGAGGKSALHFAVAPDEPSYGERKEIVRLLVEAGADPNCVNNSGNTPLTEVAEYGWIEFLEIMVNGGADPSFCPPGGGPALQAAASRGHADAVEWLLARGVDINALDARAGTTLMSAVYAGNEEMVELLLQRGADPRVVDEDGRTALTCAAIYARNAFTETEHAQGLRLAHRLVPLGTPLNTVDCEGMTPLDHALDAGDGAVAAYLKEHGAHTAAEVG